MTYFLAIRFLSQSLVTTYRALNLTQFWNFGYGLRVQREENYLYIRECVIILRKEIPGNNGLFKITST